MKDPNTAKNAHLKANEVTKDQRTMLGEKVRNDLAKHVANIVPTPEAGKEDSELAQLSTEKISAWLEHNKDNLRNVLPHMFNLKPEFKMTDDELALFMGELKDPAHVKQKTFFALNDWLSRVKRNGQKATVDEKIVIEKILGAIENSKPPLETEFKKSA